MSHNFNFNDSREWLLSFLTDFKKQNLPRNDEQLKTETIKFATANINKIFVKKVTSVFSTINESNWKECAGLHTLDCRSSKGFAAKNIPNGLKFNVNINKDSADYKKAEQGYNYLRYYDDIITSINTPSSDYTKLKDTDFLNKYRLMVYLQQMKPKTKPSTWIDIVLKSYNTDTTREDIVKRILNIKNISDSDIDFDFLALHFDGDLGSDYETNHIVEFNSAKLRQTSQTSSPIQNKSSDTKSSNSFFSKGGRKSKKRLKRNTKKTRKNAKGSRKKH